MFLLFLAVFFSDDDLLTEPAGRMPFTRVVMEQSDVGQLAESHGRRDDEAIRVTPLEVLCHEKKRSVSDYGKFGMR